MKTDLPPEDDNPHLERPLRSFGRIKARPIKGLDEKQFAEGDWVIANLKRHGLTDGSHFAEISERITSGDDPEAPWWVVLRRHDLPRSAPAVLNRAVLEELVQVAFSQRRKILRNTLGRWLDEKSFSGAFDLQRRAEEVSGAEYQALAAALS